MKKKWLLPENIDDILPDEARQLETMRRRIVDLFDNWGYELVSPPIVEFLESLVAPDEDELLLQTFKLTDQLSGKTLGVRADMTPQIARIDAHALSHNKINRLCYCDTILKTRPDGVGGSRAPIQFGAEVYGHNGIESTLEIVQLMQAALKLAGAEDSLLSLGHVGIYLELVRVAQLSATQHAELIPLLHTKAKHEIYAYLKAAQIARQHCEWFADLSDFCGDSSVLQEARQRYSPISAQMAKLLDELQIVADKLSSHTDKILFDLSDLPCYHYEAGVVFSAFIFDIQQEVARGGCYDGVGEPFGCARPAVGFSGDMRLFAAIHKSRVAGNLRSKRSIFAPRIDAPELQAMIKAARANGDRVIIQLGEEQVQDCDCNAQFVHRNNRWTIEAIK